MNWIVGQMKWIMLVSGLLTCTTFYAAIDPQAALRSMFGATLEGGALTEIIVRNWGALITLVGGMLIYGAYNPPSRLLVLSIAGVSKLIFISLVLIYGQQYLQQAGLVIVLDAVFVGLFSAYVLALRKPPRLAPG